MLKRLVSVGLLIGMARTMVSAAPLFPDVPEGHWAKDAVAALAANGLLEGYPDGTFKGDRAATRWEVAMIVARLLAKMEQSNATFATKADLDDLRKLADSLKDELAALGVRVTNLEENTSRLDKRVTELERITFYGSLDAKYVGQSFHNTGVGDNDALRGGTGTGTLAYVNYNNVVGSTGLGNARPQQFGVFPTVDYRNGRALVNGSGFTMKGILGIKLKVSSDVDAGVEFASYTSAGNQYVDAYQGIAAPFLSNPFTSNSSANLVNEGGNNTPFTRMTLDNFWVLHKPSNTKLRVGSIYDLNIDRFVYNGEPNYTQPGIITPGPRVFPGFGFQATGDVELSKNSRFKWEGFGVKIGSINSTNADSYLQTVAGGDISYEWKKRFDIKLNFSHYQDESTTGQTLVGLNGSATNVPFGGVTTTTYYPLQWVNPPGFYANQRSNYEIANTVTAGGRYIPNTVDTRPIPGWNNNVDNALGVGPGAGGYGPVEVNIYGASTHYKIPINDDTAFRLGGEYAHSDFKPNKNSTYSRGGDLGRFEVGATLFKNLDLSAGYLYVDPTYNPDAQPVALLGLRPVRTLNFTGRYLTHDTANYPVNREGIQLRAKLDFDEKHGQIFAKANWYQQVKTSLYDVRVVGGSLGAGVPTNNVLGFSPGFIEPVFQGYASPLLYGPTSASSFTDALTPMENNRGYQQEYGIGGFYKWDGPGLRVDWNYERNQFRRNTSLTANMGGSQNFVNISTDYLLLGLSWNATKKFTVRGGSEFVVARGHLDPLGLYNGYAVSTGSTNFNNLNSIQSVPYIGLDYKFNKDLAWSNEFRVYNTRSTATAFAGATTSAKGVSANPFDWNGFQVMSEFHLSF